MNQDTVVDVDLTGKENLRFQGRLQQMRGKALEDRIEELLKMVQLEEFADKPAGRYSGGMKKRLDLASALIHKPRLLFLDEPTTGLESQSRASIWEQLNELNKNEGITILPNNTVSGRSGQVVPQTVDHRSSGSSSPAVHRPRLKQAIGHDIITISLKDPDDGALRSRAKKILSGSRRGRGH